METGPALRRAFGALALGVVLVGCHRSVLRLTPLPPGAQAVSLLGDTLWNVPLPPGQGPQLVQLLHAAQRSLASQPSDPAARLLVARRTAGLGRLRDAIATLSEVIADQFGSARVFRRRGDLLFQLREFPLAERDYRQATREATGPAVKEFVEDSAGGLVGSLVRYQALLGLGQLHYVRGDFVKAARDLTSALEISEGADELVETGLWLTFALRRAGRTADAGQVVRGIPGDLAVKGRIAELSLLRLFRGDLAIDSIRAQAAVGGPVEESLFVYGLGFVQLVRADTAAARDAFWRVIELGQWTSRPYLAAEAELARLARPGGRRR